MAVSMNDFYLVTGSTILTDAVFFAYGGASSGLTGTITQRQAAYAIAETFAAQEIGTPLIPTTFTGTFSWYPDCRLQLPWKRLQSILNVTALRELYCDCEPVEIGACAIIMDTDNGVIDLRECGRAGVVGCACAWAQGILGGIKQARIAYVVGVPAGMAAAYPGVLQGLTIAADLALTQMIDCGADGDPMITSFSDTGYSESRQGLIMTSFGGSPRANYAARMFEPLRYRGALRMR